MNAEKGDANARAEERRVYSYFRFSSPEQADGRSEARQVEKAAQLATKRGLPFDTSLRMFDRGTSAFTGQNSKFGALGAFLTAIEKGKVARGSILVVENIDRITRLPFFEAFDVVSRIIRGGVKIYTTSPEVEYDENTDDALIYGLVGQIMLGHSESKKKSERVSDGMQGRRAEARRTGRPVTKSCPKWLRPVTTAEGELLSLETIPEAVRAIRTIFELRAKGLGKPTICRKLNTGKFWKPPLKRKNGEPVGSEGRWRVSYISKILRSRAVIGEFLPHRFIHTANGSTRVPDPEPILRIYPKIIERGLFAKVQQMSARNNGRGDRGRPNGAHNIFRYIVVCGYCGGPMAYQPKGRPPKGRVFLICDAGRSGSGCGKSHAVRYDEFRETILDNCTQLRPEVVLPGRTEQAKARSHLRERISEIEGQVSALVSEIEKFQAMVGRVGMEAGLTYHKRAEQKGHEKKRLEDELTEFRKKLSALEADRHSLAKWTTDLVALKNESLGSTETAAETRSILHEHLRSFIEKIEVFTHGYPPPIIGPQHVWPARWPGLNTRERKKLDGIFRNAAPNLTTAKNIEEYIEEVTVEAQPKLSPRRLAAFLRFAMDAMASKRARFFRVHFRSGIIEDFVPPKSIAMGWALTHPSPDPKAVGKSAGVFIHPPAGALWREFAATSQKE